MPLGFAPDAAPIWRRAGRCSLRPPKVRALWRTTPPSGLPWEHPLALLRERLAAPRWSRRASWQARVWCGGAQPRHRAHAPAPGHRERRHLSHARGRERPGEVIVWERSVVRSVAHVIESRLLEVHGELQQQDGVTHLIARRLIDRSALLGELLTRSRIFTDAACGVSCGGCRRRRDLVVLEIAGEFGVCCPEQPLEPAHAGSPTFWPRRLRDRGP